MNTRRILLAGAVALALGPVLTPSASAQAWPSKPVTIVVPFPPGGITDQLARALAQKMQESLRSPVVVENRPGGGGQIAAAALLKNEADGHTLLVGDTGALAINPGLYQKFSYDPVRDFQPVTLLGAAPLVLVVPPKAEAKTATELVAQAKRRAEGLNYASQGVGTVGHLLGEMFRTKIGANLNHVAYKGSAPALADVIGGQVDLLFDPVSTASPLVNSGRVRALAIAAPRRSPALPDVKTLAELGIPGVEANVWFGLVARAGTPAAIVERLNDEAGKAMKSPDVVRRFADQGLDVQTTNPAQFGAFLKAEAARWMPLVKASGASLD